MFQYTTVRKLIMVGMKRDRDNLKKYRRQETKQEMTHLQLTMKSQENVEVEDQSKKLVDSQALFNFLY